MQKEDMSLFFTSDEIKQFQSIKKDVESKINERVKQINKERATLNFLSLSDDDYQTITREYIKNLEPFENKIITKQRLQKRISMYDEQINTIHSRINKIQHVRLTKLEQLTKQVKQQIKIYINSDTDIKRILVTNKPSVSVIKQVVLARTRTFVDSNTRTVLEQLDYLSLCEETKYCSGVAIQKLRRYLLSDFKPDGTIIKKAIEELCSTLEIKTTYNVEEIHTKFPKLVSKKLIKSYNDYTGNNLIEQLISIKNPFALYTEQFRKTMESLIQKETPQQVQENKAEFVIYNPGTDTFTPEGYLFRVYRYEKNLSTGQPFEITEMVEDYNPRTGNTDFKKYTRPRNGKTRFIRLPVINPLNPTETIETWKEVPLKNVQLLPMNYDSCIRFTKPDQCNSNRGLAGYPCTYSDVEKRCKTTFN